MQHCQMKNKLNNNKLLTSSYVMKLGCHARGGSSLRRSQTVRPTIEIFFKTNEFDGTKMMA